MRMLIALVIVSLAGTAAAQEVKPKVAQHIAAARAAAGTEHAGMVERLCGSLQVDITKAREVLGWKPPLTVDEGLARVAAGF